MSERIYEEVFKYAMNDLHNQYIAEGKEAEFDFNFNLNYVEDSQNIITVSVASNFMKANIQSKGVLTIVENKIKELSGLPTIKIECIVKQENLYKGSDNTTEPKTEIIKESEKKSVESKTEKSDTSSKIKKHPLLQEEFTFTTFIPGDNSNFAYNAALAVSKNPGKQYNPILLYGGSGLGKTHLMQAIGNYIYNNGGEKLKICYVSAESFTNEFILSTKEGKTTAFKNKYRNLDVLLLDDIHFLQNKEATQEELFYTFNALNEKHAQMVFTCDRPIKEIKNMAARLVSRLSNGLCIDLQPPSYETRVAILQKKMESFETKISPEIIDYIAKNIETNVRELESALYKVNGYAELVGETPNLETVKNLLRDIMNSNSNENISLDTIQKVIADEYNISIADLKGKKRDKKYVVPRQISIYIARELTEMSYTELGNEFGGKDHSTIMSAYNKVDELIKTDPSLDSKIQLFIREIKEYNSK